MTKQLIRIFPDYCSSGIWTEHANTELSTLGIDDYPVEMALEYWHWVWEHLICCDRLSEEGITKWNIDGEKLVKHLNLKYGDRYIFRYDVGGLHMIPDEFHVDCTLVPDEPTEEMIQAACLNQCEEKKYKTYDEWWNSHTTGISERIRKYVVDDYKAMLAAYKDKMS